MNKSVTTQVSGPLTVGNPTLSPTLSRISATGALSTQSATMGREREGEKHLDLGRYKN